MRFRQRLVNVLCAESRPTMKWERGRWPRVGKVAAGPAARRCIVLLVILPCMLVGLAGCRSSIIGARSSL